MSHNPLDEPAEVAATRVTEKQKQAAKTRRDITRHRKFDPAAASATIAELTASMTGAQDRLDVLEERHAQEARSAAQLAPDGVGWEFWKLFSSERSAAKRRHQDQVEVARRLGSERDEQALTLEELSAKLRRTESALRRYQSTDPAALRQRLTEQEAELALLTVEADDLHARKTEVDRRLAEPLAELRERQAALRALRDDLDDARRFDRDLDRAPNGYERKLIHDRCADRFGASSPRAVIGRLERSAESVERTVHKLDRRVNDIARRSALPIHALVIDGSNLCFEGREFIGFAALAPLVRRLAARYAVTVVFDASIRRRMDANDAAIRSRLPGAKVHVVATQRKADETILDSASDEYVFIVSNDRFAEFREKPAVRDDRLIRHEIVNGRAMLHDLGIVVSFDVS